VLLEHNPSNLNWKIWRRRPDLNRGWRFCRFNGVVNRVVSCWFLVDPAPPFCLVFGRNWTTSGLRSVPSPPDPAARPPPIQAAMRSSGLRRSKGSPSWISPSSRRRREQMEGLHELVFVEHPEKRRLPRVAGRWPDAYGIRCTSLLAVTKVTRLPVHHSCRRAINGSIRHARIAGTLTAAAAKVSMIVAQTIST
jgi:hypothetical protein